MFYKTQLNSEPGPETAALATAVFTPFPSAGPKPSTGGRSWKKSDYHIKAVSPVTSRTKSFASGMQLPYSRQPNQAQFSQLVAGTSCISTLPMRASILPSPQDIWGENRALELPSRPRSEGKRVELPPIRQVIPEIELLTSRAEREHRTDPISSSNQSDYVVAPSLPKRRRLSTSDDHDSICRDHSIQRLYRSPPRPTQRSSSGAISPTTSVRRASTLSIPDSWGGSSRNSPHMQTRGLLPRIRSPPFDPSSSTRSEWRPTLPSLPSLIFDLATAPVHKQRNTFGEYSFDSARPGSHTFPPLSTAFDPPIVTYHPHEFPYGYQQPRGQSYLGPLKDKAPCSASTNHFPGNSFSYGLEMADGGNNGKQRKRRGNLPKETTDKLRAWFMAHLQHPYPTEDEKQELMKHTGLQMNQISNWFINARRRQLPTMINNARVESDARSVRGSEEDGRENRVIVPLGESDDCGSSCEDEYLDPGSLLGPQAVSKTNSI